ncbi:MAG: signal peptidase II [Opitutaceae bacterium]
MSTLPARLFRYRCLLGLALGVFALDQATKLWIASTLPLNTYGTPGHIEIVPGFFNLVHVGNTGAAWSVLTGRSSLLALLGLAALAAIFCFRRQLGLERRIVQIAFGLLCGGIAGNFLDRVVYGHVVDFLDFHFGDYIYPTFNIADSGIVCGVALYAILSFRAAPADSAAKA